MQPILIYWFAAQQQTSTSRRQKFDLFYPKFSSKFNELSRKLRKQQEVAKKGLKLKQSRKPHICGIWCPIVNTFVDFVITSSVFIL